MTAITAPLTNAQLDHLDQIEHIPNEDHQGNRVGRAVCHQCGTTLPSDSHRDREQHVRSVRSAAA